MKRSDFIGKVIFLSSRIAFSPNRFIHGGFGYKAPTLDALDIRATANLVHK
jgi:hypothetical protein